MQRRTRRERIRKGVDWREFEDKSIKVHGNLLTWPHYTDLRIAAGIQSNTYFKKGKLPEESKLTYCDEPLPPIDGFLLMSYPW
jgi:hypothetical protein